MYKRALGYVENVGFLGGVSLVNFDENFVVLTNDEDAQEFQIQDVEFLSQAFFLQGIEVFDKDVLGAIDGKLYLVEVLADESIVLHRLDDKLEIVSTGKPFKKDDEIVETLDNILSLQGNFYELVAEVELEREAISIVKHFHDGHYTYYYACDNKVTEDIDLIKVFIYGTSLDEYERESHSYEDFDSMIEEGVLKEVSGEELANYLLGALYEDDSESAEATRVGKDIVEIGRAEDQEECCEKNVSADVCDNCGEELCDCDLWN